LKDNNPPLFKSPELDETELAVLVALDRLKSDLKYLTGQPRRWTGLLRRNALARAVQGSNSIEGYNVTLEDAIAAVEGEEPLDSKNETWLAVAGYRLALTFVLQKAEDPHFKYSEEVLKSLHFMMVSWDLTKNPGRWRRGAIFVKNDATGEIVYEGPPAEDVQALVAELTGEMNHPLPDSPGIVQAAMAHLNLVMIHPFSDGNGRMARGLQTLVLARSGLIAPHFSSIEEYLGRNTQEYYAILAEVGGGSWHPERDARPWVRFCLRAHYHQALTLLRRSREMNRLWDAMEELVQKMNLPERAIPALVDASYGRKVRNTTYRTLAGVTEVVAGRDLKALADAGLFEKRGENRGRHYEGTAKILEIRRGVAEPRAPLPDPFAPA
jgi:Fic family protein